MLELETLFMLVKLCYTSTGMAPDYVTIKPIFISESAVFFIGCTTTHFW